MTISSPSSLGVPHSSWRPHQYESYEHIRDSVDRFIFAELPTGCGKSALATALGSGQKVTALMSTLGLLDQYRREYGFTVIKGRQEYPCADIDKIDEWRRYRIRPTAFDCHLENMHECDFSHYCPYLQAKKEARYAQRLAMTYKYASLASWPRERKGILVCDEGHATADEILGCTDFLLTDYHFKRYSVSPPRDHFSWRVQELMTDELRGRVVAYLQRLLTETQDYELDKDRSPRDSANWRFHLRVDHALNELSSTSSWFLDASRDRFQLRPLDARPIAKWLWTNKSKVVFMSATIGDPNPLALELGIDFFDSFSTPHLIPKEKRPVHVIFSQRMTKRNRDQRPGLYRAQAYAIAKFIREEIPESWRGLILTTSYYKIDQLRSFLRTFGLNGRIWETKEQGVSKRIAAFIADPSPSIISVDTIQGWGHGLDLRGDLGRFVVVAGVPYYNPSDPFDQARLKRPGGMRYARWTAYNSVVQACGRVTRGEKTNGEYQLNVAALADGSATSPTSLRYYPGWFKEALNGAR